MKRLIVTGFIVLSAMTLTCCTGEDLGPEAEVEEHTPTVTETFETVAEITPTKTPQPTDTPQPTATSTPELKAEVELLETASYVAIGGNFGIIGLIKNIGEAAIDYIWITTTFRDPSGAEVAIRETSAYVDVVFPGETIPFRIYHTGDLPDDVSYEVELEPEVASDYSLESHTREFEVISAEGSFSSIGNYYSILGEMRYLGEQAVEYMSVHVTLFNAEGKLIGYDTAMPYHELLSTGSTTPFEFFLGTEEITDIAIDHFELLIEGIITEQVVIEEPTPEDESVFKLVDFNAYYDFSGLHVVCLLQNMTDYDLEMVWVTITLRDSAGKIIAIASDLTGIRIVRAGDIVPFEIFFFDTPSEEIGSVEAMAKGDIAPPSRNATRDFEIVTVEGETTDLGFYKIKGEIKNTSTSDVERVHMEGVIYDAEGKILGVMLGNLDATELAAGETTSFAFSFTSFAEGEVDHFELFMEGFIVD